MGHPEQSRPMYFSLGRLPTEPFRRQGQWGAAFATAIACSGLWALPVPSWAASLGILCVLGAALVVRRSLLLRATKPVGRLVLDERGLSREANESVETIARWPEPFGLTVLASRSRGRLVLAFTTRERTRYIPVDMGQTGAAGSADLLSRATVLPEEDLDHLDHDARLGASGAAALVQAVVTRAPEALERIYLTAARGEPVELEGRMLRAGERLIDLGVPLDCRSYCFHESGGRVATLYQATWVRQAEAEVALVAPQPGEPTASGEPPPREIRFAIDRLFMLPLRRAIERAPRASRPNPPSSRPLREGHA